MAKTIIVTGGASGFGQRLVEVMLEKGWNVVCADRDTKRGEPLVSEWAKRFPKSDNAKPNDPPRVVFKQVDVSKMEAIKEVIDFTSATFGGFEALANNAGIGDGDGYYVLGDRLHDKTKWEATIQININAVVYGTQLAIKHYKEAKKKGTVMNTGSVGAFTLSSVQPMYNATKSFVVHFTRCLYHFREQGIRVNVVCPGPSPTPLFLAGRDVPRIKESFKELQTRLIPIDEVVRAMVIAIEDESLAGAVLRADAGQIDIFNPDTLASKVLHKL